MGYNNREYFYKYITTGGTYTLFTGKGTLHNIVLNSAVAASTGIVRILDNNTGTTANIGIIAASTAAGTFEYDVSISKGLIIDTGGTNDITVSYTTS